MKKKLLVFGAGLILALGLSAQFYPYDEGSDHHNIDVNKTTGTFTIDGVADEAEWEAIDAIPIVNNWWWDGVDDVLRENTLDPAKFSASMKLLHATDGIYILVDVTDDVVTDDDGITLYLHVQGQNMDSLLFFDLGSRATTYRLVYQHGHHPDSVLHHIQNGWGDGEGDPERAEDALALIDIQDGAKADGYILEMFVPYTIWEDNPLRDGGVVPHTEIDSIAFEVVVGDDDEGMGELLWNHDASSTGYNPWLPYYIGKLTFVEPSGGDLFYPYDEGSDHHNIDVDMTSGTFVIDGVADEAEWEATDAIPIVNNWWWDGVDDVLRENTLDPAEFSASMKLLHATDGIYILVDVTDDVVTDGDGITLYLHVQGQNMDSLLFFDLGSRATTYRLVYEHGHHPDSVLHHIQNGWGDGEGDPERAEDALALIDIQDGAKADGYILEMFVPFLIWEDNPLRDGGVVPYTEIDSIAFEVVVGDDDEGMGELLWNHDASSTAYNPWLPYYIGKLTFVEVVGIKDREAASTTFRCYPNPVSEMLVLENTTDIIESVIIMNVVGQRIMLIENAGSRIVNINTSEMAQGIYFVTVRTGSGETQTSKIIKK